MTLHHHRKTSAQSISFVILFIVAFLGTYISYVNDKETNLNLSFSSDSENTYYFKNTEKNQNFTNEINTSNWVKYENKEFGLSFKMPKGWKVEKVKPIGGFSVLKINPGDKYYDMYIYISKKGYYATDGLPTKTEKINGYDAININDLLYGITDGEKYFTFDIGISLKLKNEFKAMISTVSLST